MNVSKLGLGWVKKEPLPSPKEDLLTRIKDQKGKAGKLMTTLYQLHSLINSPGSKKILPKRYTEEELSDCKWLQSWNSCYRKCGSSEALDTHWKSAMEPISLGNNQQKQENK